MFEWVIFNLKDNIAITFCLININSKVCASIYFFYLISISYISTSV